MLFRIFVVSTGEIASAIFTLVTPYLGLLLLLFLVSADEGWLFAPASAGQDTEEAGRSHSL